MPDQKHLRLPVVSLAAEYLVMGHLMRRNVLAYKAPPNNEGYDLICIHPDPKHKPAEGKLAQVRVQVKSRYATDCDRAFPVKEHTLGSFDFLVVAFLNIGTYFGGNTGATGRIAPEFFTLTQKFIRDHHNKDSSWQKVRLKGLDAEIEQFRGDDGFDRVADALGVPRPTRPQVVTAE